MIYSVISLWSWIRRGILISLCGCFEVSGTSFVLEVRDGGGQKEELVIHSQDEPMSWRGFQPPNMQRGRRLDRISSINWHKKVQGQRSQQWRSITGPVVYTSIHHLYLLISEDCQSPGEQKHIVTSTPHLWAKQTFYKVTESSEQCTSFSELMISRRFGETFQLNSNELQWKYIDGAEWTFTRRLLTSTWRPDRTQC